MKQNRIFLFLIIILSTIISFVFFSTFQDTPISNSTEKIHVVSSFYPYYEFTRNIVGDHATVTQYLPNGVEPHDWEPSAVKIQSLIDTDVFVYNGLGMESYVDNIQTSGEFGNLIFIKASDNLKLLSTSTEQTVTSDFPFLAQENLKYDPHIWLDPILVQQQVNNIRDGLIQSDPVNTNFYTENALQYNEKLNSLDAKIISELSSCKKDTLVSFHNAFAYLGQRYAIKIVALSGLAPDSEITATKIAQLIDYIKNNDIKIIFAEELVDPRLAQVIAEETGTQILILSPIEGLTPQEVSAGMTYIEKMEQNLDLLKIALECT